MALGCTSAGGPEPAQPLRPGIRTQFPHVISPIKAGPPSEATSATFATFAGRVPSTTWDQSGGPWRQPLSPEPVPQMVKTPLNFPAGAAPTQNGDGRSTYTWVSIRFIVGCGCCQVSPGVLGGAGLKVGASEQVEGALQGSGHTQQPPTKLGEGCTRGPPPRQQSPSSIPGWEGVATPHH